MSHTKVRPASYVIPWAMTDDGVKFVLLGRERYHGKWSAFGGGLERNETHFQAAQREMWEESMGFIPVERADELNFVKHVKKTAHRYYSLLLPELDPQLPLYYRRVYDFVQHCGSSRVASHCSEKTEVAWVLATSLQQALEHPKGRIEADMHLDPVWRADLKAR